MDKIPLMQSLGVCRKGRATLRLELGLSYNAETAPSGRPSRRHDFQSPACSASARSRHGPVDCEIAAIQREDRVDLLPLRKIHQCGIGQLHSKLPVFLKKTGDLNSARDPFSPRPPAALRRSRESAPWSRLALRSTKTGEDTRIELTPFPTLRLRTL